MPFRYLAGRKMNLVGRGVLSSSDADPRYPLSFLGDGDTSTPFQFLTNGADRLVTLDLSEVVDGGLEDSLLAAWIAANTGTGTSASTAVGGEFRSGARALKVGGGASGVGARYQDLLVRPGETRSIELWMRGDATVASKATLFDPWSNKYLKSDGTWQTAAVDFASEAGVTYLKKSVLGYTVQGSANLDAPDLLSLRLTVYANGNGFGYVDDVRHSVSRWNFAGLFMHNISRGISVEVRSSNDAFVANDVLELTLAPTLRPFYGITGADIVDRGWVRLKLVGTNPDPPQIGEWVVGQAATLAQSMNWGWRLGHVEDHNVLRGPLGKKFTNARTPLPRRSLDMAFHDRSLADYKQFRDDLYGRARGELYPVVVAPRWNETSDDSDVVLHGSFDGPEWNVERPFLTRWHHGARVVEDPYLTRTP